MNKICFRKKYVIIALITAFVLSVFFFSNKIYKSKILYNSRASEVKDGDKPPTLQRGFCYNDMNRKTTAQCGVSYPEKIDYQVVGIPFSYDAMVYRLCPESDEHEFCQYMCVDVGKVADPSDDRIRECWTSQTNRIGNNSTVLIYNTSEEKIKINRIKHTTYWQSVTHADEIPPNILEVEPKSFIRYRLKYGNKLLECQALEKNVFLLDIDVHYQDRLGKYKEKVATAHAVNLCQSVTFNGIVYVSIP